MKKISVLLLVVLMTITSLTLPASAKTIVFSDVPADSWEAPYVYSLVERGIVSGYGDGTFGPQFRVQRCEYAKMLVGISDTEIVNKTVSPYTDVPSSQWYFPYINSASEFMTGYTENGMLVFRPEWDATREDVAAALVKALKIDVSQYTDPTAFLSERFHDVQSISIHNRPYVAAAVDKGYLTGDQEGTFRGQDFIIRAEVSAVLCRAFPKQPTNETIGARDDNPIA